MKTRRIRQVRVSLIGFLAAATVACSNPSPSSVWPGENWATSRPEAEGINSDVVDALVVDIDAGVYGSVDHFLLIRHGYVVADRHFSHYYEAIAANYVSEQAHGNAGTGNHQYNYDHANWHPYYRGTELHTLQSITKSVISAALGIAVDGGMIEDVHIPVMPFFTAYDHDLSDPRKSAITLEDFLIM